MITAVNPQCCLPYFTFDVPIFEEDTALKLTERIRRFISLSGMSCEYLVAIGTLLFQAMSVCHCGDI